MTRRDLALALAAAPALAQQPSSPPEDMDLPAREQTQKNRDELRKFQVPMATEPSFTFRP